MTLEPKYNNNLEVESDIKISGKTTPLIASLMVKQGVPDISEDVSISYDWGDAGATAQDLEADEAASYLLSIAGEANPNVQALGKEDEPNYWRENEEAIFDENIPETEVTNLPNPIKTSIDGDIEAGLNYKDGILGLSVEFDTAYEDSDEAREGHMRITYAEPFESNADSELARTHDALQEIESLKDLLEQ